MFKSGEEVICIDNSGYSDYLTKNKRYKIVDTSSDSVTIASDDENKKFLCNPARFVSIKNV